MYDVTAKKNRQAPHLWACRNSLASGRSPPLHNCEHNIMGTVLLPVVIMELVSHRGLVGRRRVLVLRLCDRCDRRMDPF
jgi:hypothetical protein